MATKVIMPKQGLQMTEGTITKWLVAEGCKVEAEMPLFEMETDKLSIEIAAPVSGTLLKIIKKEGETVPITEMIAVIGDLGEDISGFLGDNTVGDAAVNPISAIESTGNALSCELVDTRVSDSDKTRVFITPRARMTAETYGIDYKKITGTGPEGIIIEKDILKFIDNIPQIEQHLEMVPDIQPDKAQEVTPDISTEQGKVIPFTGMRRIISDRMMQSLHGMAQANHRMKVDMSELLSFREKLKSDNLKVSITDIIVKVVSRALKDFPIINSSLVKEGILLKEHISIGLAVAVDKGLVVPVIRDADKLSLKEISEASATLIDKAKTGSLKPLEYSGGTFTVTNLGMFDIDEFTAIINPPESAILAIGKIDRIPVVEGDDIVIKPIMVMSLTYDHRIIDGAPAAWFLQRVKLYLQNPYLVLC